MKESTIGLVLMLQIIVNIETRGKLKYFVPLNKKGIPISSKAVHIYNRHYTNTETESKNLYNYYVDLQIDFLNNSLSKTKADKI